MSYTGIICISNTTTANAVILTPSELNFHLVSWRMVGNLVLKGSQ